MAKQTAKDRRAARLGTGAREPQTGMRKSVLEPIIKKRAQAAKKKGRSKAKKTQTKIPRSGGSVVERVARNALTKKLGKEPTAKQVSDLTKRMKSVAQSPKVRKSAKDAKKVLYKKNLKKDLKSAVKKGGRIGGRAGAAVAVAEMAFKVKGLNKGEEAALKRMRAKYKAAGGKKGKPIPPRKKSTAKRKK
jgi:hypothetical protein